MQYFQTVKKVSLPPKPILTKASNINVTEVLNPNIAFCILETHKREIQKASLLFFWRWLPYALLLGTRTKHNP